MSNGGKMWPATQRRALEQHRFASREEGIYWGLGLSPVGWQEENIYSALRRRCRQLSTLEPDFFCLLFDDMPGAADSAQKQADLVHFIFDNIDEINNITICPTWYSYDPILENLYGPMPPDYLRDLGRLLPPEAGVLWSGEEVCARRQSPAHLSEVAQRLGRRPVLWDNFPVNDGHPDFLHLAPFTERPASLEQWTDGYFANPMQQGLLSRLPLFTLGCAAPPGGCLST